MGGVFGGSSTVSVTDKRINSMRIQQSAYGLCQPLVYGKNRVAANMFWYGDFLATAHTTTKKSGGKGGGSVKTKTTTYTYSASMMLGLCENKIRDIGTIWRDKEQIVTKAMNGVQIKPIDQLGFELFDGDYNPVWGYLVSKHPNQALHYPYLGYVACANYELGGSAALSNHNFEVISDITFQSKNLFDVSKVRHNKSVATNGVVSNPGVGCSDFIPVEAGVWYTISGYRSRSYMAFYGDNKDNSASLGLINLSRMPAQFRPPVGARYVVFDLYSNINTGFSNIQVEEGQVATAYSQYAPPKPDANPADVIEDYVTNPRYGAAPGLHMADLTEFRDYCTATGLFISPVFTEQRPAHETIAEIVEAVNCAVVPSPEGLKIRSFGDSAVTGNGSTYIPNLTPIYHLTDDDFIGKEEPVRVRRSRDTDAFNHVQIEYANRFNQYNVETVEAKDQANIEMFGLRTQDPVKYDFFCEPKIARHAAQLLLQRRLYVRNEYEFQLGWKYCLLEPMDIVTITDESLGLDQFPVRITRVEEDEE